MGSARAGDVSEHRWRHSPFLADLHLADGGSSHKLGVPVASFFGRGLLVTVLAVLWPGGDMRSSPAVNQGDVASMTTAKVNRGPMQGLFRGSRP
jgi:hypothetical protein